MLTIAEIIDAMQNPAAYDVDYRNGELFIVTRAAAASEDALPGEPTPPRTEGCPTRELLQRRARVRITAEAA